MRFRILPYKNYRDKKKRRRYLRNYMRKRRREQKALMEELKEKFPDAYAYISGLKVKRRKK